MAQEQPSPCEIEALLGEPGQLDPPSAAVQSYLNMPFEDHVEMLAELFKRALDDHPELAAASEAMHYRIAAERKRKE